MIYLPDNHPLTARPDVGGYELGAWRERPSEGVNQVLLLNLMPEKEETDRHFTEVFARTQQDVQLILLRMRGMTYKTTPAAYVDSFYVEVEEAIESGLRFDRLIVTGAPLENVSYEDCRYWERLCGIIDWAARNVRSTLYICWGAMAALYYRYGVPRYRLDSKCFGVFPARNFYLGSSLLKDFGETVTFPHSRHITLRTDDIVAHAPELKILADGKTCGPCLAVSPNGESVYLTGHPEYDGFRLDFEYRRDLSKGLEILPPENYYAPDGVTPVWSWKEDAARFYRNWLRFTSS